MIHTNRTVTVGNQESIIDSPIILYRGDREVEVEFTLNGNKFTFTNDGNVIKSANATHGQLVVNTPSGENMFSEVSECHEGKVVFVITKEMIDELIEVGFYSFQIRLFDESQVSRVTIPPVFQGIDIRNPIAAEDETNVVDIGLVDYAVVQRDEFEYESTFLPDGNYNKTNWLSRDVITEPKLNKIEDALYAINSNMEATDLALLNRLESINQNVNRQITEFTNQADAELDEFERSINNNINVFKEDMNVFKADMENFLDEELINIKNETTDNYINLKNYKYLVTDNGDWTLALQTAVNENGKVVITENIKIYGTVTLGSSKVIEIGVCTVSKPADATDNGPIFWIRGNQNTIRGQGQGSSVVSMGIQSPEGAIRIGHSTDTKADTNCLYNQVCDLQICGYSKDDGVSVALMMRNAETDGLASYFHTISNVRVIRAHMGIVLRGYMNANLMNNIQLYNTGGNQTGGGICFLGIGSKVPMENSIHSVFHHQSPHACTLLIDCATFFNKVTNILSEQGGTNARCLKVTENGVNAFSNTFATSPNVNYGNIVNADFTKRNIIEGFNSMQIGTVTSNSMSTTSLKSKSFNMNDLKTQRMYKSTQQIAENETVTLFTAGTLSETSLQTCLGTVKMVMRSGTNVGGFMQVAEQKFKLFEGYNTFSVEVLSEVGRKLTWTDGALTVSTMNNGTNTKNFTIWFELELFGYQWTNLTIGEKFEQMQ